VRDIEKTVRDFIVENFLFGNEEEAPEADDSFLELRLIDSTGILTLVLFLEETYDFKISDDELNPENLDSLTRIADFIEKKKSG